MHCQLHSGGSVHGGADPAVTGIASARRSVTESSATRPTMAITPGDCYRNQLRGLRGAVAACSVPQIRRLDGVVPRRPPRCERPEQHHHRRSGKDHRETAMERPGDELREEAVSGQRLGINTGRGQRTRRCQQLTNRVVAQKRREQAAHRRVLATCSATPAETPCCCNPAPRAAGKVLASPITISEKKMPIDSDVPALKNVARTPDAAPRWSAGTLDMTTALLGAVKIPPPGR